MEDARAASRLLIVKAARRMRRDGWDAGALRLWLGLLGSSWSGARHLPAVHDDQAILLALAGLWTEASLPPASRIARVGVTLLDLTPMAERQIDMLAGDEACRTKREAITEAIDRINGRYGRTLVSIGEWSPPPGGYAGGKISYTRIPSAEDFW